MKTISVDEAGRGIAESLRQTPLCEPLVIVDGEEPVAFLIGIPKGCRETDRWKLLALDCSSECATECTDSQSPEEAGTPRTTPSPRFGSCRGMLSLDIEDDAHLREFGEYLP